MQEMQTELATPVKSPAQISKKQLNSATLQDRPQTRHRYVPNPNTVSTPQTNKNLKNSSNPFTPNTSGQQRLNFRNRLNANLGYNNLLLSNFSQNSYNYPFSAGAYSYTSSFHNNGQSPLESPLHPKKPQKDTSFFDIGRHSMMNYKDRMRHLNSPLFPPKLETEYSGTDDTQSNTMNTIEKDVFKLIDGDESNNYSPPRGAQQALSHNGSEGKALGLSSLVKSMNEKESKLTTAAKSDITEENEQKQAALLGIEENFDNEELSDSILERIFLSDVRHSLYPKIDRGSIESSKLLRDSIGFNKKEHGNRNSLNSEYKKTPNPALRHSFGETFGNQESMEKYLECEFRNSFGNYLRREEEEAEGQV